MSRFTIKKDQLIYFVKTYQQASYDDHFKALCRNQKNELDWLLSSLCTDYRMGIRGDLEDIKSRKEIFGTNQKEPKKPPSLFALVCQALEDFLLRILILSACVSIGLEMGLAAPQDRKTAWIEGFAILMAVAVCAGVAAGNNYQKQKQFIELNSVADEKKRVTVWRNGQTKEIHQDFVLVGDVVGITEGMQIPADGILIESNDITIDQSSMTGQTNPIVKNILNVCLQRHSSLASEKGQKHVATTPVMMGGTRVLTGEGKMLVIVVGDQSCMGKIRAMLEQEDQTKTPLQQKLQTLADNIGKFALASASLIMAVLFIRFGILKLQTKKWDTKQDLEKMLGYIIVGIAVIVMAIPEGLPLSVTLSLAFSVKKMLKDQNLVRRMEACETMGGANNICSDKTGTLTMNKMILTEIWNGKQIKIDTYAENLSPKSLQSCNQFIEHFKVGCLVNSTAMLVPEEKGSSTEIAFLKYFDKMGIHYQKIRDQYPTLLKFPFSSARKRMSVVLQNQGEYYLYIKGASEIVLKSCSHWITGDSIKQQKLNNQVRSHIEEVITNMATKSLRTLCVAYRKIPNLDCAAKKDQRGVYDIEKQDLTLVAVIGVRDNPRKEVPDAIKKCHRAGITVRMVTGDNIVTAKAIAKEIGLIRDEKRQIAMQGTQFNKIVGGIICKKCKVLICDCPITAKQAEEQKRDIRVDTVANGPQFDKLVDKLLVLARSRPEDKYCLVTGLKERGHVVAVTGDGTNDAPALKKADVGFAMGIAGTEVAREAAAIILIDDNFNSIVKAVLWGRNIYDSIRKFLQFQLTINIAAVVSTLIASAILQKQVMKPIQLLWINLIMDSIASLALSTESPHESLLLRKPYQRDANIVSKLMKKNIVGQSIYQTIIMVGLIFFGERFIPEYRDSLDDDPIYIANPQFKWLNGVIGGTVCSGRFYLVEGGDDYATAFNATKNYSRHYTFIFNTFVMLQIFNFINSRKIHGEINVFQGILKHRLFYILVFLIFAIQVLIIMFAGYGFGLYPNGLTIEQWGISLGIGSTSLIVGLILTTVPYGKDQQLESLGQNGAKNTGGQDVYRRLREDN